MIIRDRTGGLKVQDVEWSDLTRVDRTTYETAKKIEALATGLTAKQFTEAVSIALDFVGTYSILVPQSTQPGAEPG